MGNRNKSRLGTMFLFVFLMVIFICTSAVLAMKLPEQVAVLSATKTNLDDLESVKENLKDDLDEVNEILEQAKQDLEKAKEDLAAAKAANPDLADALENETHKYAYLTFDDGPSENTIKILDFLQVNNIKATFFVLGKANYDEVYKRIVDEGHTLAIHSNTHNYDEIYASVDNFLEDINALSSKLEGLTGVKPDVMRFPGGSNNTISKRFGGPELMDEIIAQVNELGLVYFDWNVDSADASANKQDKNIIVESVLNGARGHEQAIILMHDAAPKTTTVDALPEIVAGLRAQGFSFERITAQTHPIQFKK